VEIHGNYTSTFCVILFNILYHVGTPPSTEIQFNTGRITVLFTASHSFLIRCYCSSHLTYAKRIKD
jgi:hypothetical protein